MIYISHKQQAKIITTRTLWSSTDLTNKEKKLLRDRVSLLSHYFQLLKKLLSNRVSLLSHYFFYYKKQQATSKQPAARCLFIFFYSKKQQATSRTAASSQLNA
jgi:hypothetical protein